jgi:hypothetical protein
MWGKIARAYSTQFVTPMGLPIAGAYSTLQFQNFNAPEMHSMPMIL